MITVLDLFSGIGGFAYASEKIVGGFKTVAFCDNDPFCQQVLKKNFPGVPIHNDVKELEKNAIRYRGYVDVVCGGFPCQPFSNAGKKEGHEDKKGRDLWSEMASIIEQILPRFVIGENVRGFVAMPMGLSRSVNDLESIGYRVAVFIIPSAYALGLPHRRERCWIIAEYVGNTEYNGSSSSTIRRSNTKAKEWTSKGQNKTFKFEGTSGSENDKALADTNNSGQQQSHEELANKSSEQFDIASFQPRSNVSDTKRMGWEKRSKVGEASSRERRNDNISDSSRSSGETKDITDTNGTRLERHRQHTKLERQHKKKQFTTSSKQDIPNSMCIKQERSTKEQVHGQFDLPTQSERSRQDTQRKLPSLFTMGRMVDGISERLGYNYTIEPEDLPRTVKKEDMRADKLKAFGNSIIPQCSAVFFQAIKDIIDNDKV